MSVCPECGSRNNSYTNNEQICDVCGLVLDDALIGQEFIDDVKKEYAYQPYLAKAESGVVDGKVFKALWLLSSREKSLKQGNEIIEMIASKFNLTQSVVQESKLIFKKLLYTKANIGRDNISLSYASTYIACIIHETPKTARELTLNAEVNATQLMRSYRVIRKKLDIMAKPMDPLDLLPRFASKLELTQETTNKTAEIITKVRENNVLIGCKPDSILAGAIYQAGIETKDIRTQRQISYAIGLLEVTIRSIVKEIKKLY